MRPPHSAAADSSHACKAIFWASEYYRSASVQAVMPITNVFKPVGAINSDRMSVFTVQIERYFEQYLSVESSRAF